VPTILRKGAAWFAGLGKPNNGGTDDLLGLRPRGEAGQLRAAAMGIPFAELLEMAGGVQGGRKLKAVIPGGSSMPVVPAETMLDVNMDYDSLKARLRPGLGRRHRDGRDHLHGAVLERLSRFYMSSESCGQCTPCREGTGWLNRMLIKRIVGRAGQARGHRDAGATWPTRSRATPSARSAMPRRGRCRASSSISGTSSNT
jgi:NADH-quinone oxidoreductase subunit F